LPINIARFSSAVCRPACSMLCMRCCAGLATMCRSCACRPACSTARDASADVQGHAGSTACASCTTVSSRAPGLVYSSFTWHCRTTCSGRRPRTWSGTCACSIASASVRAQRLHAAGQHVCSQGHMMSAPGYWDAPLDGVLLGHAVLHAHARLLAPPPRDAVPLTIEHHVEVHACGARARSRASGSVDITSVMER